MFEDIVMIYNSKYFELQPIPIILLAIVVLLIIFITIILVIKEIKND